MYDKQEMARAIGPAAGYQNTGAIKAQESALQTVIAKLDALNDRLSRSAKIGSVTADRMFGPSPEVGREQTGKAGGPESLIGMLHARLEYAAELTADVECSLNRLSQI